MLFSVVVPVYNVEKYLRECVESILRQTFDDFELILVDDGSKDSSGAICDEYAATDNRIKVIHKKNGGQSTARNAGIDAARGEYAIFLDSDDLICDNNFFSNLENTIEPDTDVVVFRYCKYFEDKRVDECGINLSGIVSNSKVEFLRELVKRDAFFCSCWSKCTRMSVLKDNGIKFDENLSCEDMDWYYNVVSKVSSFKVIDKPFVYYRQRANSVTSSFKKKSITDYIFTIEKWSKIFDKIEDNAEKSVMLSSLAKLYCNLLISYSRHTKELRDCKKKIFSFKYLLSYNLNPRTAKISKFSKVFGLGITCTVLNILGKMR